MTKSDNEAKKVNSQLDDLAAQKVNSQLDDLAAEFPGKDIQQRKGMGGGPPLTYVSIDATLRRLNDVLGPSWSIREATTEVREAGSGYVAMTQLYLDAEIDGVQKRSYGVGAMKNPDPDMAMKSALAEAVKKAGHALGISLYLWDDEGRKRAEQRMKLAKNTDSEAALKQAVFAIAKNRLGQEKPSASAVAKVFGIKVGELADKAALKQILEAEGVL